MFRRYEGNEVMNAVVRKKLIKDKKFELFTLTIKKNYCGLKR